MNSRQNSLRRFLVEKRYTRRFPKRGFSPFLGGKCPDCVVDPFGKFLVGALRLQSSEAEKEEKDKSGTSPKQKKSGKSQTLIFSALVF